MRYWLFLALFALLFGCLTVETESGLDKWTPAGDGSTPTLEATPTAAPTNAASPTPGASPTATPKASVTPSPSPSPSPEPAECTVIASGQDVGSMKKLIIVRFTQEVSDARMRCHSTRSWQSLDLELMLSSGEYQGSVECTYTSTGTYTAMAEGGGAECEKEFELEE